MSTPRANKRIRIEPEPIVINDDNSTKQTRPLTPLARAEEHISSTLQSLQPGLAAILLDHSKAHLKRLHKLHNKSLQIQKMERDNDFFPRLTRFEFQLHCTKATEQREGYTTLQEKVKTSLTEMKQTFKTYVIDATKLETDTESDNILEEFCKSIRTIVDAYLIGPTDTCDANKIVAYMFQENGKDLLSPPMNNVKTFKKKYLEVHKLTSWPALGVTLATHTGGSQHSDHEQTRRREENSSRLAATIYVAIQSIFPTAWSWYIRQEEDNHIALQLKKLKENQTLTDATAKASSNIEMEESVEPEKLHEMVTKSTRKETKQLKTDIATLTSQVNELKQVLSKKDRRGTAGPVRQNRRTTNRSLTPTRQTRRTPNRTTSSRTSTSRTYNKNTTPTKRGKSSAGGKNNASHNNKNKGNQKNGRRQSSNKNKQSASATNRRSRTSRN